MTFLKQISKPTLTKHRAIKHFCRVFPIQFQDWCRPFAWTCNATRYLSIIWPPVCYYLCICVCPCILVSNYWPLTLAITVPAAPRMSAELSVWCLPMTALRTRSNSAKRSCTTSWSSSRFSGKRRGGTSRLGHVSRKTLTRLTKVVLIPKPKYHAQFAITNFYLH